MKKRLLVALLGTTVVATSLGLTSCLGGSEYRIGVSLPLSGAAADKGTSFRKAMEISAGEINAAGGVAGHKIKLIFKDDANDPAKAKQAAQELVQDKNILAVVGTYYPEPAIATAKVCGDSSTPCVFPVTGSQDVINANKFMFSVNVRDDEQGNFMAVYLKEVLKKDNVLLIHNPDPFGTGLRDAFLEKAGAIGLNVLKVLPVDKLNVTANFISKNLPDREENEKFGAVVALTHSESGLAFLPQLRENGIKTLVIAPSTWTNRKFLTDVDEKYTKDVYVTASFLYEVANERANTFADTYQHLHGELPPPNAALAYDSVLLLARGLESLTDKSKGKLPTRESLRDWLAGITSQNAVEGATGNLFFKSLTALTDEYVSKYYDDLDRKAEEVALAADPENESSSSPEFATVRRPAKKERGENRAVERNLFVSVIRDGRYKVAPIQLSIPHEEYVLKELAERVKKGYVTVVDGRPYHIVDVVFLGVDIIKINDVNTRDMNWDADLFMWFKWTGSRLDPKDIEKFGIINLVKEQSSTLLKEDLASPTRYRALRKRVTLGAEYDFARFPYDAQVLPLKLAHSSRNSTHIMLAVDSRHMDDSPIDKINPQEWTFEGKEFYSGLFRYRSTFGDPDYRMGKGYKSRIYFSTVNIAVKVHRILQPYIFTFFLPLFIILGIILLALWIPVDQFAPRINSSISGLVGVLVYHMSQKNSFPKVGYTMMADYYFLCGYLVIVVLIVNVIRVQILVSEGKKDLAREKNRFYSRTAIVAVIVVYLALTAFGLFASHA